MKRILLILLYIIVVASAKAQIINSIGIKDGVSFANQTWYYTKTNETFIKKYNTGMYSVVSLDFLKATYLNITTDLGYCEKGNIDKVYTAKTSTTISYNTKFNYLTLSPVLKVKYPLKHFIPYALIGLRLDYQLSYKSDYDYSQIENNFNKTIIGMSSGVGLEYKFKYIGVNCEFQYHYDYNKVMNTHTEGSVSGIVIYNTAYIISGGIKYYFHKKETPKQ